MNKKVIGVIIVAILILVTIIGVLYLVNNDSLNTKNTDNDTNKAIRNNN